MTRINVDKTNIKNLNVIKQLCGKITTLAYRILIQ